MTRSLLDGLLLTAALGLAAPAFAQNDPAPPKGDSPAISEQAAEVLPSITESNPNPAIPEAKGSQALLLKGPAPEWIWGADYDTKYRLTKTFKANSKSARLFVSCDNSGTVFLNGQQVMKDVPWDSPKTVDAQKYLKEGENEIVAEVANEGGVAAFLCKLAMSGEGDKTEYVVSDASWKATAIGKEDSVAVRVIAKLGDGPWGDVITSPGQSNDPTRGMFRTLDGFQVERLYTVPKDVEGSWVAMSFDGKGRVIASDQGEKGLYRITPAPIGSMETSKVEKIPAPITSAQGLLWAFDSLYCSVNGGPGSGLYRVRDTNGDDQLDEVTKLATFQGGGEHGPHALRLSPDGKSIFVICGNHTRPPEKLDASRLPTNWQEDQVVPRMWDANGHAVGILAPGGWVAKTDPDGKTWELFSAGYRNPYDMDFNADGELFVYDADMEWDVGSPWYRPTRVNHATSGSELGWRSGSGKWPSYYPDSLPPLAEIGPGSPVGAEFGYGTKFPAKYQKALYICDWTFGTMYAIHLEPSGSSYKATAEEFLSRTPLPLTDCDVGPDGALYFTVGGRGTQSELFRVSYVGKESTAAVDAHNSAGAAERKVRSELENLHHGADSPETVVKKAWPHLASEDRFVRYAARIAIEHQPASSWVETALSEMNPDAAIQAAVALARQGDKSVAPRLIEKLNSLDYASLDERKQLDLLRAYGLVSARMGELDPAVASSAATHLDAFFPAKSDSLNRELCSVLVALKSPTVLAKTLSLIASEPKAEIKPWMTNLDRNGGYGGAVAGMLRNQPDLQKIQYVYAIRNVKDGWTMEQRKAFFGFLDQARTWSGGASFRGFLRNMDRENFEALPEKERLAIEAAGARKPDLPPELPTPKGPGKDWMFDEIVALGEKQLTRRDFKNGEKMFSAARCILCHRFGGDGGATGPDLTLVAGRFNLKDLTDAMVNPSKVVSDQYKASIIETTAGQVYTGRLISETDASVTILLNPEDATKFKVIPRSEIETMQSSQVSIMPAGLLKPLSEAEMLDLMAYLLSRGNGGDAMFRK
jgi:putative heme-binding domain-containing protein